MGTFQKAALFRKLGSTGYKSISTLFTKINFLMLNLVILLWKPQGNRKRGRPRNSWRRSVIKEAGRSWNELRFIAADRQKWKGLIDNLCS